MEMLELYDIRQSRHIQNTNRYARHNFECKTLFWVWKQLEELKIKTI